MESFTDKEPIVVEMKDVEVQCRPTIASCGHRTRFLVLTQGVLFLAIIFSSIVCWNPAMIVLIDVTSSPLYDPSRNQSIEEFNNPALSIADRRIPYSTLEKSTLFAGIFIGAISGVIPMSFFLSKFGTHKTMIGVGILSVFTTALTPFAAVTNFYFLVFVRILQGTTLANPFPVIGSITNTWSSLKESGLFVSILTGFIQLAAIFTMPVSGILATNAGWDVVFYVHAAICAILCALWGYNFRDDPMQHPFVSDKEVSKISIGKQPKIGKYSPPYKAIITTPAIWGVWIATCANFLVAQFAITYMPMYFVYVCKFKLSVASIICAIPLLVQFSFKFAAGAISDRLTSVTELTKVRCFNTLAFWGAGFMLIICGLVPSFSEVLSAILVGIAIGLLGFNAGGFTKCAVLVSRQYSPTVMAVMQVFMCLSLFGGSYLVPGLTPNGTHEEYAIVFYIYAAALIVSNFVFCFLAQGEAAEWTRQPEAKIFKAKMPVPTLHVSEKPDLHQVDV